MVARLKPFLVLLCVCLLLGCTPEPSATPVPSPSSTRVPSATSTMPPATLTPSPTPSGAAVSGIVVDSAGTPLADATVRVQGTDNETLTDAQGRYILRNLEEGLPVTISAWKETYYCANATEVTPPATDITLILRTIQTDDNPYYVWIPPVGETSCYSCKPGVTQVWLDNDAHSRSATNPRFLSMYNGTDLAGNQSPLTRYAYSRDYGRFPLRPDPTQPYYGPGYRLDFPNTTGNCAACHTPGAAVDAAYATDPNTVSGADAFGVHCDFCHKVADVQLNPETGLPYPNMPGVLSMDIRRPFPEDPDRYQIFFGTFADDNVPMEDTYLPSITTSQFCAPCHFGQFWDTVVYNSFGEWLASPYSDPAFEGARTCQQCHMPAPTLLDGQPITNVAPEAGGIDRDPMSIHSHTFPGASSEALLQNAVTMAIHTDVQGGAVTVRVEITNDRTGHDVPTDSPLRHLILLVQPADAAGDPLAQTAGPTLPDWTGVGDPALGYYAGLPGTAYARILQELWTEISPSGAYWNPTRVLSDNRIAAFATASSEYAFDASTAERPITIDVTLLFRRAFIELMDQKGWDVPDIIMEHQVVSLP
jgi:hypothetical protein